MNSDSKEGVALIKGRQVLQGGPALDAFVDFLLDDGDDEDDTEGDKTSHDRA